MKGGREGEMEESRQNCDQTEAESVLLLSQPGITARIQLTQNSEPIKLQILAKQSNSVQ